jgi:phosphoribosyl 1,2-cyclic phosphodiesterase
MFVHFKGTRGSIPTAPTAQEIEEKVVASLMAARGKELRSERQIREFVSDKLNFRTRAHWGGNTPCIHVDTGSKDYLILDGGSGLRALAKEIMTKKISGATFHIFLSHFHYDHIQGIPFFAPAYAPSNRVVFHGGHEGIEKFLRAQMCEPFFPISFDTLGAEISFEEHKPGDVIEVCDSRITLFKQNHPGLSYGYRVENQEKAMVYSTDCEHTNEAHSKNYPYLDFIRGADLLIFDAPYTLSQSIGNREHWGHSSNVMGVELAARADVRKLAIFHHDPNATDENISEFFAHTRKFLTGSRHAVRESIPGIPGAPSPRGFPREVLFAYDGLTMEL